MFRPDRTGQFIVYRIDVHPLIIGIGSPDCCLSMIGDDPAGVQIGEGLYRLRAGKQGMLTGDDLLDAIGQVLPLFFGEGEVRTQVEHHPLSGTPFGPQGFKQFEGVVLPAVLFISMDDFADKHD